MTQVYASIGSNINSEVNVRSCCQALEKSFGPLEYSTVYETEAVGFVGEPFINLAIGLSTDKSIAAVIAEFRAIEKSLGRDRSNAKFSSRTIDVDLLLYDRAVAKTNSYCVPREEIIQQAFVLKPLLDLCQDYLHPVENKTIQQLWDDFGAKSLPMTPIKGFFTNG